MLRNLALCCTLLTIAACGGGPTTVPDAGSPADPSAFSLWGWAANGHQGSNDEGDSWTKLETGVPEPIGALRSSGSLLVVAKDGTVSATTDNGKTWKTSALPALPVAGALSTLSASTSFCVGSKALVYRSVDDGASWTSSGTGLPAEARIESMVEVSGVLLAGSSTFGVFRSTDDGQTWAAANTGMETAVVNAISVNVAVNGSKAYAAVGGTGIFVSTDSGQNWTLANGALPVSQVYRLWVSAGGRLFAAPAGAGLWSSADGTTWTQTCSGLPAGKSVVFLATSGSNVYLLTTQNLVSEVFRSADNGQTCTQGKEPTSSGGISEMLTFLLPR